MYCISTKSIHFDKISVYALGSGAPETRRGTSFEDPDPSCAYVYQSYHFPGTPSSLGYNIIVIVSDGKVRTTLFPTSFLQHYLEHIVNWKYIEHPSSFWTNDNILFLEVTYRHYVPIISYHQNTNVFHWNIHFNVPPHMIEYGIKQCLWTDPIYLVWCIQVVWKTCQFDRPGFLTIEICFK